MAYRQAVKTGMYIATIGDSRQDLKIGKFKNVNQGRNFQSSLDASYSSRRDRMRSLDGSHSSMGGSSSRRRKRNLRKGLQKQKRQNQLYVPNALQASISSVTVRTYRKVERTLLERFHKFAYRKAMIPMWKMYARFKTFTTFTPDQMRQFLYGVALTMHMFTKYNRRAVNLNQQLQSVFLLVFLPFAIPPMVVLGIPLLFFLIPLMILITGFTALNRQAKQVMERNRRNRNGMRSGRSSIFTAMGKSVNSTLNMAGTVVGDGIGFTANVAGTVVGGVATGVGEVTRQMSFVSDHIMDIGDGVRSTATKLGRRSSRMISNNLKRTSSRGSGSRSSGAGTAGSAGAGEEGGRCGSGNRRRSVFCAKSAKEKPLGPEEDEEEKKEEGEYCSNNQRTRTRGSSITSSTYFENYNRRHNHHNSALTNSTLTNSWDMEMVSSFESTDSNYSALAQQQQRQEQRPPRALLDSTTIRAMDLSSSENTRTSAPSVVDTTPRRNSKRGGERGRRNSFSTASLRLWRQRNTNGSNHNDQDDNNNNSSNDTPTTNNTEPSASSLRPSSLAGSRQRRNGRRRRSGFMGGLNRPSRSRSRRVSFAAVEEIRLMSERGSSFLGMDDNDDSDS